MAIDFFNGKTGQPTKWLYILRGSILFIVLLIVLFIIIQCNTYWSDRQQRSSTPQITVTLPPVPTGVIAAAKSSSSIIIRWDAISSATKYRVYQSTSEFGTFSRVGENISNISFESTGLSANTTYYYKVSAFNSAGESVLSSTYSATTYNANASTSTQNQSTLTGVYYYLSLFISFNGNNFTYTGTGISSSNSTFSGTYRISSNSVIFSRVIFGSNTWVIVDSNTLRDPAGDLWRKR